MAGRVEVRVRVREERFISYYRQGQYAQCTHRVGASLQALVDSSYLPGRVSEVFWKGAWVEDDVTPLPPRAQGSGVLGEPDVVTNHESNLGGWWCGWWRWGMHIRRYEYHGKEASTESNGASLQIWVTSVVQAGTGGTGNTDGVPASGAE